ncbi:MAG: FmdE family protein, partial [Actinomycetota bacterium]
MCAGLALGARVVEVALAELGPDAAPGDLIAAVETHTCSADAVQVLTGCTLGNGKLFYLDYAKNAYSFWAPNRQGVRVVALPDDGRPPEFWDGFARVQTGTATEEELASFFIGQQRWSEGILNAPAEQLFHVERLNEPPPTRPIITAPVRCASCGEATLGPWASERDG